MQKFILEKAGSIRQNMEKHSEYLYAHPELGFELENTVKYVTESLKKLGITPQKCGKSGISACINGDRDGPVFLLRADMDALGGLDSSCTDKNMHACGHHMHTAMLLGAAEILVTSRDKLFGTVKLMFQGAEEILEGANDMIQNGILEAPVPDGAMMLHVISGVNMPLGSIVVSSGGVSAPAADFFSIEVEGRGTHGALPHLGIDPISASAHIITAFHEINARELPIGEAATLTVGKIYGGENANVIPDKVVFEGSLRAFDTAVREKLKERLCVISKNIANALGAKASISFTRGCPPLINDETLSKRTFEALGELFGTQNVKLSASSAASVMIGGSDDFSYISQRVPSVAVSVCAGSREDGYEYPLHNPRVSFDKRALPIGAAIYAGSALGFLSKRASE